MLVVWHRLTKVVLKLVGDYGDSKDNENFFDVTRMNVDWLYSAGKVINNDTDRAIMINVNTIKKYSQQMCSIWKAVLKISQYSQENACVGVYSYRPEGLQCYWKETPRQMVSYEYCEIFKNNHFAASIILLLDQQQQ